MTRISGRWLVVVLLLAGCRFAPLPPTAKIPPGYRPIRPAGPERTATKEDLAAAFAKRSGDLIGVLRGGSEENRAFAREELGRMGRVVVPALAGVAKDEDDEVRGDVARALGATRCEEALAPLRALASDDGWSVREAAAEGMGRLRAKAAGETLLGMLEDDAWRVRLAAIRALGEVGEARAVASLVPLAEDVDEDVRYAAFVALAKIGDPAGREAMLGGLDAPDPHVRRACAEGLGRAGGAVDVEALARRVLDESQEVRLAVVLSMTRLSGGALPDPARLAVDDWIDALALQDPSLEYPARQALGQLGAAATPWLIDRVAGSPEVAQVTLLQLILLHPDPRAIAVCEAALPSPGELVRRAVVDLLAAIRTPESDALLLRLATEGTTETRGRALAVIAVAHSEKAAEAIGRAVEDPDPVLRHSAVELIDELPEARRLPLLAGVLEREPDDFVRFAVVRQLGLVDSPEAREKLVGVWKANRGNPLGTEAILALGRTPAKLVREVLLDAWNSDNALARSTALNALLGNPDEGTVALLEQALTRDVPDLWPMVVLGLARLAPERALVEAKSALESEDRARRMAAVQALAQIPTPESAHMLEMALRQPELEVASAALDALEAMPAEIAAPAVLRVACEHEDAMLRVDAAMAFAFWGYVGAAPRLRERLAAEEEPYVRCALVSALGFLQDEASAPAIAEAARSEDPRSRMQALTVLGLVGTPSAIPPLVDALKDPDPSIRQLGAEALGNLRAEEGIPPLVERLADPEERVRRAALVAVATYGDPAREPLLIDAMRALHPDLEGDALRIACAKEFWDLGFPILARCEFENALRNGPEGRDGDIEAHLLLAEILPSQRAFADAATHARAALMLLPPDHPDRTRAEFHYHQAQGVAWLQEGKEANGLKSIEAALQLSSRGPNTLNNLAYFLSEAGVGLDRAWALVEEALRMEPDKPYFLDTAGWIAYQRGDFAQAKSLLSKAHAGGPTIGEIPYHLAKAEIALGEVDSALEHLKRAVELDSSVIRKASQDAAFHGVVSDARFKRLRSPAGPR